LTRASVLEADMLFATLDPTLRAVALPHGTKAILSDTVGFISELPTMLVAAFRATLEEVIEADVILHVRDVSHSETEFQARDVETVLCELDIDPNDRTRLIEVWNKIDLLGEERRTQIMNIVERREPDQRPLLVSAASGEGLDTLTAEIESRLAQHRVVFELSLDPADGASVSWLYRNAEVMSQAMHEDGRLAVTVRVDPAKAATLQRKFSVSGHASAPFQC
jgi:GTPase